MTTDALFEHLRRLETELHDVATRRNEARFESLLHADFVELGRSGQRYDRGEVLHEFSSGGQRLPPAHAQDFEIAQVGAGVALLTYRSAHVDAEGELYRFTLRSSLWLETVDGWQLRFHQGTPTDAFARDTVQPQASR